MNMTKNKHSFASENITKTLHKNLEFTAIEQYKLLRTNLYFTIPQEEKCPIIGITSAMRGGGKSTTAINLSYVLGENGHKVLLIDGDLRLPSVAMKMNIPATPGLTDLIMGKEVDFSAFQSPELENWYIVPSGEIPPNPSELLGSARMESVLTKLKEVFDYVIVDLPPVNLVTDALSISKFITGMILVIREGYTAKKELEHCVRQLKLSNVNVLGCLINDAKSDGGSYGKYYKKYKYYKYYRSSEKGTDAK